MTLRLAVFCMVNFGFITQAEAQSGACCTPDNGCDDGVERASCILDFGGDWLGEDSTCKDGCPDCDCDGESDIATLARCLAECIAGAQTPRECDRACDANGDGVPNQCQDGSQDPDRDRIVGQCDNCPGVPNPEQEDTDEDGVGDACGPCEMDDDCDDDDLCTDDVCIESTCWFTPVKCPVELFCSQATGKCVECVRDADCGIETACLMPFCDGEGGVCKNIPVACPVGLACDEETGECVVPRCYSDAVCDDGVSCNGVETCGGDAMCRPGEDPCIDAELPFCDEADDACVQCLSDEHCDDENTCTQNRCVDGTCSFPSIDCPLGRQCVPPNGVCVFCADVPEGMCCDPIDGGLALLDDGDPCTQDTCWPDGEASHLEGGPPPLVEAIDQNRIRITLQPDSFDQPVALLVTSPDFDCLRQYVGLDGSLVDEPTYRLAGEWSEITVDDPALVPGSAARPVTISVQTECGEGRLSGPGTTTTSLWGDVNTDSRVDIFDILCVLDAFTGELGMPDCSFATADIGGCARDSVIDIYDILDVLDAYVAGAPPCGDPCDP